MFRLPPSHALIRILLLAALAEPSLAHSLEQDLPAGKPLEIELEGAELEIVLEPGAAPRLVARGIAEPGAEAAPADGPVVQLEETGSVLRVVRAAGAEAARLRLDVTLDVSHPVKVTGRDLDVTVAGPALDFRKMAMRRRMATERGAEPEVPAWSDVTLILEDSRADLSGVSGAVLEGRDTWFVVRKSANQLAVELEGGAAKLTSHRGKLHLVARVGEIELRDAMGEIGFDLKGSKLEITDAEGKLEGQARADASVVLYDWGGPVFVESFGSTLELRGFRPGDPLLEVVAEGSNVTVEGMDSGQLTLDQKGGRLRVLDVQGKMKITATAEADVELERLRGSWKGIFEDSTIVADEVERFDVELIGAELRLTGAADLRLTAGGSEVVATEVQRISQGHFVDTVADLELTARSSARIEARGESRVSVRVPAPCVVAILDHEGDVELDVVGCTLGEEPGGEEPGDGEAGGAAAGERPSFLTLGVDESAELSVRGL